MTSKNGTGTLSSSNPFNPLSLQPSKCYRPFLKKNDMGYPIGNLKLRRCRPSTKSPPLQLLSATTIIPIIFWDFLMFYQTFLSPQVKRWTIITYKHRICELPHKLPNDLRLRILGMIAKFMEWLPNAQSSCENENFVNTCKKPLKNGN